MAHVRLFGHYIHLPFVILGLIDLLILIAAFSLTVFFRFFGDLSFFSKAPRLSCRRPWYSGWRTCW